VKVGRCLEPTFTQASVFQVTEKLGASLYAGDTWRYLPMEFGLKIPFLFGVFARPCGADGSFAPPRAGIAEILLAPASPAVRQRLRKM